MERFFTELPPQFLAMQQFSEAHPEIFCSKVQTEPPPHQDLATQTKEVVVTFTRWAEWHEARRKAEEQSTGLQCC